MTSHCDLQMKGLSPPPSGRRRELSDLWRALAERPEAREISAVVSDAQAWSMVGNLSSNGGVRLRKGWCLRPGCGCESYCRTHGLPSPSCRPNITLDIGSTLVITTHAVVATFVNIPVAAANGIVAGAAGVPVLVVAFRVPVPACRCFLLVVANIHHQGAAVRYFDIHLHCLDAACLYGQGLAFWTDRFGLRPVVRVSDRQNWVSQDSVVGSQTLKCCPELTPWPQSKPS